MSTIAIAPQAAATRNAIESTHKNDTAKQEQKVNLSQKATETNLEASRAQQKSENNAASEKLRINGAVGTKVNTTA